MFTVKVPDEEWDAKHKLALEREMLGLYVSGHPLNGVEHVLAAQVDTQIPAILDGDSQRRAGDRRRHPRIGEPADEQERLALGLSATRGPHRRHRGAVLPAVLLGVRREIAEDAVVLVKARVSIRDDRISLIANDLVVPDLSARR